MNSQPFEDYLAGLEGTRNGQAFKKELGNRESREKRAFGLQSGTEVVTKKDGITNNMDVDAGYFSEEPIGLDVRQIVYTSCQIFYRPS